VTALLLRYNKNSMCPLKNKRL